MRPLYLFLPILIHPCTLDPGDPCLDDEVYVAFTGAISINTKPKPKFYTP